jgi:hypothetical protein
MLEYQCPQCSDLFSHKCLCPECNVNVVRVIKQHQFKRVRRHPGYIEDDGPSDEQKNYFARGGR